MAHIRQTSLMAYYASDAEQIFGKQSYLIYDFFKRNYPVDYTRNEISRNLGIKINAVCGRINELIKAEWLEEVGKRKDTYSKKLNMMIRWKR